MSHRWMFELYRNMRTAREVDERERVFIAQNLAHFHVSGAGHEGSACLARHLIPSDWLHLHYRDKALLLARGLSIEEFFRSLLGTRNSHSAGRQMSAHFSAPHLNVLSLVGPVGNNALQAAGVAAAVRENADRPIVVCSLGDGTTQQGEVLEAIAEAVRWKLPVLFLVQNNRYSISTLTPGKTFFSLTDREASEFYGLPIHRCDGSDVLRLDSEFESIIRVMRHDRGPQILVTHAERLSNHTNADDQSQYRTADEITSCYTKADPVAKLRKHLLESGSTEIELRQTEQMIADEIASVALHVTSEPAPDPVVEAKAAFASTFSHRAEYRGNTTIPQLTMREALCAVLRDRLENDSRVFLYGQDIEDPKGDVFGVTRGLSTAFPGRVVNAPLSESTIVGTSIGRALTGQRPVAFIQFADFLPLAFNQIVSELGSMYWRTNGGWQCPVIIMATCGAYKPGLGPFHAQTMEAFAAHIPGIDVVMPSSAADAAGLLNAAFESPRPTLFLYPKSCLNLAAKTTSADVREQFVRPGVARRLQAGMHLTLVTWGSTVTFCEEAAGFLNDAGFTVDLFDLRSVSPWDDMSIVRSAEKTGRMIVVHEDNHTGGFGAEVIATVAERASRQIQLRRISRPDTFVPYHFGNQIQLLPGLRQILEVCAELLSFDLSWKSEEIDPPGQQSIRAIGSGPADEFVDVVSVCVAAGDALAQGMVVAELEATKSVVDVVSDCEGRVIEINVRPGDRVKVGSVICRVATETAKTQPSPFVAPRQERPIIRRRAPISECRTQQTSVQSKSLSNGDEEMSSRDRVHLSRPEVVLGSRVITTAEIAAGISGWTEAEAIKRTGIARRSWIAPEETAVHMTSRAAHALLDRLADNIPPISAIFCSTTSPQEATPSIACSVATSLVSRGRFAADWFAVDLNAACSGYLYGLRLAADHLAGNPEHAVLLLTSELLSPNINLADASTAFLFADAFSATLVTQQPVENTSLTCVRPILKSQPDPDRVITSPCFGGGHLRMDGIAVARTAYKTMAGILADAATGAGLSILDLAGIIPHPGSGRILQNVADLLEISPNRVWHTLNDTGNTSSSSIPVALHRYWDQLPAAQPLGLVAFGAGFTSAATTGEIQIHD